MIIYMYNTYDIYTGWWFQTFFIFYTNQQGLFSWLKWEIGTSIPIIGTFVGKLDAYWGGGQVTVDIPQIK